MSVVSAVHFLLQFLSDRGRTLRKTGRQVRQSRRNYGISASYSPIDLAAELIFRIYAGTAIVALKIVQLLSTLCILDGLAALRAKFLSLRKFGAAFRTKLTIRPR